MGRPHRATEAGFVYHVLTRGNARMPYSTTRVTLTPFEKVVAEAIERSETRLLPNHWHVLVRPRKKGELSRFVGWLTYRWLNGEAERQAATLPLARST